MAWHLQGLARVAQHGLFFGYLLNMEQKVNNVPLKDVVFVPVQRGFCSS
jgi:hypothetical protein